MLKRINSVFSIFGLSIFTLLGCSHLESTKSLSSPSAPEVEKSESVDEPLKQGVVTFKIKAPADTESDAIYISGEFDGWSLGSNNNEDYYATLASDGYYYVTLPHGADQEMPYIFSRGRSENVEGNPYGGFKCERAHLVVEGPQQVNVTIDQWADKPLPGDLPNTRQGNIVHIEKFPLQQFDREIDLLVYLPPGYKKDSTSRYPVMYMLDGQNLFDATLAYSDEWGVDDAMESLVAQGKTSGAIVVGLYNGPRRSNEYIPWDFEVFGQPKDIGEGEKTVAFIRDNLKPYIDENYRTLSDRENTIIAGSSYGALISFFAGISEPETFGTVGAFSPSFFVNSKNQHTSAHDFIRTVDMPENVRIYFYAGGFEPDMVENLDLMYSALQEQGFPEKNLRRKINPNGLHCEEYWRPAFYDAIDWLL